MGVVRSPDGITAEDSEVECDAETEKFCTLCAETKNQGRFRFCQKVTTYAGCGGVKLYALLVLVITPLYIRLVSYSIFTKKLRSIPLHMICLFVYT